MLEPTTSTMVVQVLLGDEETMMQLTALPDAHTLVRGTFKFLPPPAALELVLATA
jgi:hypothetical protein